MQWERSLLQSLQSRMTVGRRSERGTTARSCEERLGFRARAPSLARGDSGRARLRSLSWGE